MCDSAKHMQQVVHGKMGHRYVLRLQEDYGRGLLLCPFSREM